MMTEKVQQITAITDFIKAHYVSQQLEPVLTALENVLNLGLRVINIPAQGQNTPFIPTTAEIIDLHREGARIRMEQGDNTVGTLYLYMTSKKIQAEGFYAGNSGPVPCVLFAPRKDPGTNPTTANLISGGFAPEGQFWKPLSKITEQLLIAELTPWISGFISIETRRRIEAGETMEQIAGTDSTGSTPAPRR